MPEAVLSACQARMARSALRLTMREVAAMAGLCANTICNYETARLPRHAPHVGRAMREAYRAGQSRFRNVASPRCARRDAH